MMITSTAEFNTRAISIGLDSDDARKILGDEWDKKTFPQQMDWLSKKTDLEVLLYLHKENVISDEYLQQRAREVKSR